MQGSRGASRNCWQLVFTSFGKCLPSYNQLTHILTASCSVTSGREAMVVITKGAECQRIMGTNVLSVIR